MLIIALLVGLGKRPLEHLRRAGHVLQFTVSDSTSAKHLDPSGTCRIAQPTLDRVGEFLRSIQRKIQESVVRVVIYAHDDQRR